MRARSRAAIAALARIVGADELGILLALILIAAGFWQAWRPGAALVPGAVLLWLVLPSRRPFIARPDDAPAARRKA